MEGVPGVIASMTGGCKLRFTRCRGPLDQGHSKYCSCLEALGHTILFSRGVISSAYVPIKDGQLLLMHLLQKGGRFVAIFYRELN